MKILLFLAVAALAAAQSGPTDVISLEAADHALENAYGVADFVPQAIAPTLNQHTLSGWVPALRARVYVQEGVVYNYRTNLAVPVSAEAYAVIQKALTPGATHGYIPGVF